MTSRHDWPAQQHGSRTPQRRASCWTRLPSWTRRTSARPDKPTCNDQLNPGGIMWHYMCLTDSALLPVYYKYALISTEFRMVQDPASLVEFDGGRASNTRFLTRRRPAASILGRGFAPCTCACSPRNVIPRLSTSFTAHCSFLCNDLCQSKAVYPRRRDLCARDTRSCC